MANMRTIAALLLGIALMALGVPAAWAEGRLADGTYDVVYTVKKPDDESVSIANDYFEKPAKVTIVSGRTTVQLQMNHSNWIGYFKVPGSGGSFVDAEVVGSNADDNTRIVRFDVADLQTPTVVQMKVTIKELGYNHEYATRFVFKTDGLPLAAAASAAPAADKPAGAATASPNATALATSPSAAATAPPAATPAQTAAASPSAAAAAVSPAASGAISSAPSATPPRADASQAPAASAAAGHAGGNIAPPTPATNPDEGEGAGQRTGAIIAAAIAVVLLAGGYAAYRLRKRGKRQ
ncbi:NEAT domain-containing protein [Paenibacillus cymbidii]|uniref:NEAT domain-containing protein n=1 Tax=Paenibacillus cymbidii TaxID=1639034 RepID=UPI0014369148|nr:NEAT domain-containing protein [Paenibacillus cymbidii]